MISGKAYFEQLMQEATAAHQSGDLYKAMTLYKQLTIDMSNQPEPHHRLALIHAQRMQYESAIPWFEKAVALQPNHPAYLTNFAETLQRVNQNEKALKLLRQVIAIEPDMLEAKQKLGTVLKKIGQFEEAAEIFEHIINKETDYYPAFFQLGTLMLETGNYQSAKKYLKSAIDLNPKSIKALNNLAIAHQEWDEFDEAISCYEKALTIDPDYVDSLRNLALMYEKVGRLDQAKSQWLHLAKLKQNDPLIRWKAEILEPTVFQSNEEIIHFRNQVLNQLQWIKNQKINLDADQLTKMDIYPPAGLIYHGQSDLEIKQAYGGLFKNIPKAKLQHTTNAKPHVGFVVTGGHEGVFVKCMSGLINRLSTEKLNITIVCSFPNGEKIVKPAIENPAIKFVSLPKSLAQSVHLLVSLYFDFLHYWEVGTDAYNYFIPYFKPAKIQATSWGWPTTSGIPAMDYFISCRGLDEASDQKNYSEKLVLFDKLPTYYLPPEIPELNLTRSDFGIDESSNLYLCVQNVKKVHPDFDDIVKGILEKDKNACVVLLGDKHPTITKVLEKRIKNLCQSDSDRIVILDRQDKDGYFNILNLADVVLDTLHYNGGANTNADAFALNKPVVTMPTNLHRGRYTSTAYRQMGFDDLIAQSIEDYIAIAIRLTSDFSFYQQVQQKISNTKNQFFEDDHAVTELENFILSCFEKAEIKPQRSEEETLATAQTLQQKGEHISALDLLDAFLTDHPKSSNVWLQKGLIHKALQQWQPAFDAINKARQLDSTNAEILKKFAELLTDLGKGQDAFIAYQKALKLEPNDPETLNNFGGLLIENRQYKDAIPFLKKSIELNPNQQSAYINLGLAYEQVGDIAAAKEAYLPIQSSLESTDLFRLHIETLCPIIMRSNDELKQYRSNFLEVIQAYDKRIPHLLTPDQVMKGSAFPSYQLTYHGFNVKEIHSKWCEFYTKRIQPVSLGPKNAKPKIGFLVTQGHEGVFMKGGCGLIKKLSSDKFDIVILMNGEDARQQIKSYLQREDISYQTFDRHLKFAIKEIASLNLDFLYYWEIGSDVLNYFLPFYQLARVQVLSWGSPYTSGNPRVQHYLGSQWVEGENYLDHYTENVILFDSLPYYYYRMNVPAITKSRKGFGLPEDKNIYLCIQTVSKFHPDFDSMLKGILENDPQAIIALTVPDQPAVLQVLNERFEESLGLLRERVLFLPKVSFEEYPQRIALADVCLDTPHYAGFNTTYETLQMGTPVVTLPGEFQRSRYTEAIYRIMGLESYIPKTEAEYVTLAMTLANDKNASEQFMKSFQKNAHLIFERAEIIEEMEAFMLNTFSAIE